MTKVLITGVTGRMGSTLVRIARQTEGVQIVGSTDRRGKASVGLDLGLALGHGVLEVPVLDDLARAISVGSPEVVIDFTSPEASVEHAQVCAAAGVALLVGTTGLTASALQQLEQCSQKIPLLIAPNTSVGINLVLELAVKLARGLGEDFDVEIVETHHRLKKDAPSGTALKLAAELASALGRSPANYRFARQGRVGERPRREIGIQAIRGGDVVGEHTVHFLGDGERVELTHRATSRDQFARGALRAARWLAGRAPGLYDMADVLGLHDRR